MWDNLARWTSVACRYTNHSVTASSQLLQRTSPNDAECLQASKFHNKTKFDAGKVALRHLGTAQGCSLAAKSGNVLLLLLILLLCILGSLDQLSQTEPSLAKGSHKSRPSKSVTDATVKPASSQSMPSAKDKIVVNDTCADLLLTTTSRLNIT